MEKKELLECIDFFKELKVFETDVTSDEERANHSKVVVVTYSYKGQSFTTNKLYYKNILHQDNVKNPQNIINYFGGEVYWLDKEINQWPRGSGEGELEETIIDEMVADNDENFKALLKSIANNHKTGYIQRITADGKSAQYHHNFENNNHWHDIILLIQEIINKKGAKVDKRFFSRLVFKWDGDKNTERERSSLAKEVEWKSRAFIDCLYQNIKSIQNIIAEMEIENILKYKKQIILQGPPGTGKTREAKIIAKKLIASNLRDIYALTKEDIKEVLQLNTIIKSVAGNAEYKLIAVSNEKVTLSRENESTGDTPFSKVIEFYNAKKWDSSFTDNDSRRAAAIAKHIYDTLIRKQKELIDSEYLKLVQFHPAYSYEDFVRGIVAESKGEAIEYKTKNKLIAEFATKALTNFRDSRKNTEQLTEDNWLQNCFSDFVDFISDELEKNQGRLLLEGTTTYIKEVESDCFRYTGDNWNAPFGNRMHFKDIIEMFRQQVRERQDIKRMEGVSGLAKQHASYFMKVLDLFYTFMKDKTRPTTAVNQVKEKNFVLIIDEINRANLPAVLGELIYALEYRGEKVESMYPIDDDNTLVIPPNLYIIGTMNTSDRSVGHIDYAIRRRFAFIDVLPKVLEGDSFELELFKNVSALFIQNLDEYLQDNTVELKLSEHLSDEFRPEDVWLGHSYFIKGEGDFLLRKKYEIVPILKEYVKDGILKKSALDVIEKL
ncbi:MAG: AAA family ATPase [Bacteroidia bacterium]|nr:AAA family ATPase [Bacteroidia bacterium]